MNLMKVLDVLCEVYDNPQFRPRAGMTFCNLAVNTVCSKLGYQAFEGLFANEIVDIMEHSDKWITIPIGMAQTLANKGMVVIAGEKKFPHGHIVVIRAGNEEYSQKWNIHVPKCMNIGENNFIDKGVNWAFKDMPKFYLYIGDL